jgi:hypothetical protein
MRITHMSSALRATKSFSLEKEVLKAVEKSKGPVSASERVNELIKMGLELERRRTLELEAEEFFQGKEDVAERRAFQSASLKSFSRED